MLALCLQEQIFNSSYPQATKDKQKQKRVHQILESLVEDYPHVADYRQAIVKSYERIDIQQVPINLIGEAHLAQLKKAIQHATRLVSDYPTIPEYKISLIHAHNKMAHVQDALSTQNATLIEVRQRHESAERSIRTAIRLQEELVTQFPQSSDHVKWLAKFKIALARFLMKKGNDEEAIGFLESAVQLLEGELKKHSQLASLYFELTNATRELSSIYEQSGNYVDSILMWDKSEQYEAILKQLKPEGIEPRPGDLRRAIPLKRLKRRPMHSQPLPPFRR